jgi:hypothetical protein
MSGVLTAIDLPRHAKVRAHVDLPGVPAGMKGKVLQVSGVTWIRYRVLFENGVEHGLLDGRHLVRPKDFIPVDQRVEEAPVEAAAAANGEGAAAADDGGAADNAFGVPAHLLERSQKARERLTAG